MDYPLLKQLYAAGFEVPDEPQGVCKDIEGDYIYYPTTEEIIEACGQHFTEVRDLENIQLRMAHPKEVPADMKYEAVSSNGRRLKYGHGRTIEIAAAHLFLAIQDPLFGL
jgi:hypothetical protein